MSPTLEKLYGIFGQHVVLLPIPLGSKNPGENGWKGWQNTTVADTQETGYQQDLEECIRRGGNIGVLLGPASGGLISIDMDRDDLVDPLIDLSPRLAFTTRTRSRRGCNFFLRIKAGSAYPNAQSVYVLRDKDGNKCGEWRCGGGSKGAQTVIFGVHPEGQIYQIEVEVPPIEKVIFDTDLKWFHPFGAPGPKKANASTGNAQAQNGTAPASQAQSASAAFDPQAAYSQLMAEIGVPFVSTQRGYTINQPYFARLWAINRIGIYDLTSKDYYTYNDANGVYERLCTEQVHRLITSDLFNEAAARGFPSIGSKISVSLLKSIAELIKCDPLAGKANFFARSPRALPVIHAVNGMFRLEEDGPITRHDFSPEFRSRNMIPVPYNPDAKCPRFTGELLEPVLLDKDDIDALQRYFGLILIGGNRAQKLLMLLGEGGTGKGTIVRLGGMILGRSNVGQLRVAELNGRFETSKLVGKLL